MPAVHGPLRVLLYVLGAAGLASLAAGLTGGWSSPVGVGLALLGAEYAVFFAAGPSGVDVWTPLYAAGFLLAAELAYWSLEQRVSAWSDPAVLVRRLVLLVACCAGAAAVAAAMIVAAGASVGGGLGLEIVGITAAVAVLALVAGVARVGGLLR
ncbi:MAG TPA: hypothetical protein VFL41_00255 [Gaiellaceae bacterium]|nr:hypothetical protein [Gaiellaceae bacterium]